jgi:hypothetical protein
MAEPDFLDHMNAIFPFFISSYPCHFVYAPPTLAASSRRNARCRG